MATTQEVKDVLAFAFRYFRVGFTAMTTDPPCLGLALIDFFRTLGALVVFAPPRRARAGTRSRAIGVGIGVGVVAEVAYPLGHRAGFVGAGWCFFGSRGLDGTREDGFGEGCKEVSVDLGRRRGSLVCYGSVQQEGRVGERATYISVVGARDPLELLE